MDGAAYGGGLILGTFLLWLGIVIVVFLVCRAVVLWYFRINHIVDLLERIAGPDPRMGPRP